MPATSTMRRRRPTPGVRSACLIAALALTVYAAPSSAGGADASPSRPEQEVTFELQHSGTEYPLNDVCFVDAEHGWAVGGGGQDHRDYVLLRTSDGGRTWDSLTTSLARQLDSVFFLNRNLGWVSGYRGVILRTTDGGDSWTLLPSGSTYKLAQIQFVDENNGFVVQAAHTHFMRTTDGGNTWTHHNIGISNDLLEMHFVDPLNGWAIGNKSLLARTSDGGVTWRSVPYGTDAQMHALHFRDLQHGWVAGREIWATVDGGATWRLQLARNRLPDFLNDLAFISTRTGWGVGAAGSVWSTRDGGTTWAREAKDVTEAELRSLSLVGESDLWAVGAEGTILHRKGPRLEPTATATRTPTPTSTATSTPSPTPTLTPTPTSTPVGPWLEVDGRGRTMLLPARGRRSLSVRFGNMPATTVLEATLDGQATFAGGERSFSAGVTTSGGAGVLPLTLVAADGASPGGAFELHVAMEDASDRLDGIISWPAWLPLTER